MRAATGFISSVAVLAATGFAGLVTPPLVPRTAAARAESSAPTVTSTDEVVPPFVTPDPWPCYLANVTQYFDVPTVTGSLFSAMDSYGVMLLAPCVSTASGIERLSCSVTESSKWCGLSTAMPPAILTDYSSYVSAAYSFWTAKSSAALSVSSRCPVLWGRPSFEAHTWLNLTIIYAECYAAANPGLTSATGPSSSQASSAAPTSSSTSSPTNNVAGRNQGLKMWVLASTGMAAAAVASAL